jgi:hypothetical protein
MLIISLLKGIWKTFVLEKECSEKLAFGEKKVRSPSRDCPNEKVGKTKRRFRHIGH